MGDSSSGRVLVLRPTSGWRAVDLREVWRFRDLVWAFARRDVTLRYRQTALGVIWVILQPLLAAGIFSFVFGRVADLPSGDTPYVVFAFAGLLGWNIFQSTVAKSGTSLVGNAGMLSKIFFPRLALPLSTVIGTLLDFGVGFLAFLVVSAWQGVAPSLAIVTLPLWVLMMLMLALGIGVFASALMVSYRDVAQAVPVLLMMILYISPVAYSLDAIPSNLQTLYALNPLVGVLEGFRWALIPGSQLEIGYVLYSFVISVVVLAVGFLSFARMEKKFADVI
jgi:homopolymeric O-antigen transport system permease protein